ncbi:MAG: hypothetical protein PWP63_896 [Methanolobus sp.]|nr:hypothetical protein [Methanolobus sp.]
MMYEAAPDDIDELPYPIFTGLILNKSILPTPQEAVLTSYHTLFSRVLFSTEIAEEMINEGMVLPYPIFTGLILNNINSIFFLGYIRVTIPYFHGSYSQRTTCRPLAHGESALPYPIFTGLILNFSEQQKNDILRLWCYHTLFSRVLFSTLYLFTFKLILLTF